VGNLASRAGKSSTQQLSLLQPIDRFDSDLVAGVDEVGRGALFGPVIAAAVILPPAALETLAIAGVTDSKQLAPAQRRQLAAQIKSVALSSQLGMASVREIDRLNILQASLLAMRRAVSRLQPAPSLCLVDGNQRIPGLLMPQQTIVKGDQKSLAIAAASILAKVWRDELITRLAKKYPNYDLATNKGYGTAKHRQGIQQFGVSTLHRRSFSPCRSSPSSSLSLAGDEGEMLGLNDGAVGR
jgi:ribonuclease HII